MELHQIESILNPLSFLILSALSLSPLIHSRWTLQTHLNTFLLSPFLPSFFSVSLPQSLPPSLKLLPPFNLLSILNGTILLPSISTSLHSNSVHKDFFYLHTDSLALQLLSSCFPTAISIPSYICLLPSP